MSDDPVTIAKQWYATIEEAWNHADGQATGAAYIEPCDLIDIRGVHHAGGSDLMAQGHQEIFDTIYKDSVIRYDVEDARFLDDDTIIAHALSRLEAPYAPPPVAGGASARSTVVLLRDGSAWKCTAMHNTLLFEDLLAPNT